MNFYYYLRVYKMLDNADWEINESIHFFFYNKT